MTFWTPERTQALVELAPTGKSAAQMANELGAPSRCAVIGKLRRLNVHYGMPADQRGSRVSEGLAKRKNTYGAVTLTIKKRMRAAKATGTVYARPTLAFTPPPTEAPTGHAVRFIDRRSFQCAAILDDEAPIADRMCCGAKVVDGRSWCAWHARVFFAPPRER